MLVALVALATAQINPFNSLLTGVQWTSAEWIMDYSLGTMEAACNAADNNDDLTWTAVRAAQLIPNYTECTKPNRNDYLGTASAVDCFAAYSPMTFAGAYCTGSYCALAASGKYAGLGCTGYQCAAYASSGCPARGVTSSEALASHFDEDELIPLNSTIYTGCCSVGQGSGCLGTQCAYMCTAGLCGQMSIGEQSAWSCIGGQCGQGCQGTQCAENCVGWQCGQQCWGTSCSQNSTGEQSGYQCMGEQCAYNCTGTSCGQYCNGASCAQTCEGGGCGDKCTGSSCAAWCVSGDDSTSCGQYATGTGSAANCQGHGCGAGCIGEQCAYNATSIYTDTTLTAHDSTQLAISCFNKWIYRGMGLDWTLAETFSTSAPTAAPSTTTAAATTTGQRRERRVLVNTDPFGSDNCPLTDGPEPDDVLLTNQGPGSFCVGPSCGQNATGAFAASFCSGYECATMATGLYAGVGCVGDYCAASAAGIYGVGSYCYGYGCAANAAGAWSGSYCIGNACAQGCTGNRCGTCCVGLNCSSNATSACPFATDGGTPFGQGDYAELFSDQCRNVIDTTSSTWLTFFNQCASGYNSTELVTNFAQFCTVQCTPQLSMYLNYFAAQEVRQAYSQGYASQTLRGSNVLPTSAPEEDKSYEIATWVLVGAIVVVAAVMVVPPLARMVSKVGQKVVDDYANL